MAQANRRAIAEAVFDRHGHETFAEQTGINRSTAPNSLFQMFLLGALLRTRLDPDTTVATFADLRDRGWTTAGHMRGTTQEERVAALVDDGLEEADAERTALAFGDAALHLTLDHGGDLGRLRSKAGEDPVTVRDELLRYAAVDDAIVDGFFREAQLVWGELMPFADKKVLDAAGRLGLGDDAAELRSLVDGDDDFVRLEDALIRLRNDGDYDAVRTAA